MDPIFTVVTVLALVLFFLGLGAYVFIGLLLVSIFSLHFVLDFSFFRIGTVMATIINRASTSWELSAIPMFVWMGEMMFHTDISARLFNGLSPLVRRVPGGLLHTNVIGSALFASISGSSAATTATVGQITLSELDKRGYSRQLAFGSLAGAGSLGLLIPPSIVMIVYGVLAEVSISRLFAAGVFPGLMLAAMYSCYIALACLIRPGLAPSDKSTVTWAEVVHGIGQLLPLIALMTVVLGLIYTGVATPSESAAIGVACTILLTALTRQFHWAVMRNALMSSIITSCMITSLLIAAAFLSTAMSYLHVPQNVATLIATLNLPPGGLVLVMSVFYLILGMFLDGISITVMSLPITLPLMVHAGFDPVWFGVFMVIMIEMAQITPPVGFNLFIIQGIAKTTITKVVRASVPFFIIMCLATIILFYLPDIALWLPNSLYGK